MNRNISGNIFFQGELIKIKAKSNPAVGKTAIETVNFQQRWGWDWVRYSLVFTCVQYSVGVNIMLQ